ncbi:MAG: flagellar export chaperone FliS [Burkholderiaceae bacterium]
MFGSSAKGAHAYAQVGVETSVSSASPHKLVVLLFDGAIASVSKAVHYMQHGDIAAKGRSISHAIMIIDGGLRASLNKNAGGEIAQSLDDLYEYMSRRLLVANMRNQLDGLTEVLELLKDLRGSWSAISPDSPPESSPVPTIMLPPVTSGMYSDSSVAA